jgi:hypothetical protein
MRWHSEQKTVPSYPFGQHWDDQPAWFSNLMAICGNTIARLDKEKMESK